MDIPIKYLLQCSRNTVGEFELSRLNRAANLKKQLREILEEIIEDTACARAARCIMDNREELCRMVISVKNGYALQESFDFCGGNEAELLSETGTSDGLVIDAD